MTINPPISLKFSCFEISLAGYKITFKELTRIGRGVLEKEEFKGSPMWYITTVKLDLEARGLIERIPKSSPQQLQLKS